MLKHGTRLCNTCKKYVGPIGRCCPKCHGYFSYKSLQRTTLLANRGEAVAIERRTWSFCEETQWRTADCLSLLYAKTNEAMLLEASGGNKWIIRRAIEMYKMGVEIVNYRKSEPSAIVDGMLQTADGSRYSLDPGSWVHIYGTRR